MKPPPFGSRPLSYASENSRAKQAPSGESLAVGHLYDGTSPVGSPPSSGVHSSQGCSGVR